MQMHFIHTDEPNVFNLNKIKLNQVYKREDQRYICKLITQACKVTYTTKLYLYIKGNYTRNHTDLFNFTLKPFSLPNKQTNTKKKT